MLITATEIIKQSWRDYTERLHEWAIFSLLIFLPTFILALAGTFGIYLNLYIPSTTFVTNMIVLLLVVVSIFLGFWSSLSLIKAGGDYMKNRQISHWKEYYVATLTLIWPGIYTSIFVGLAILFGTILLIIPGIIFAVWYYFSNYNVVFNGQKGWAAMQESKKMVVGRWWPTVWRVVAPNFVFGAAILLIQQVTSGIIEFLPVSVDAITLIENTISVILSSLTAPLTTLAILHLYFSLKENPNFEAPPATPAP